MTEVEESTAKEPVEDESVAPNTYTIRPNFLKKFRPAAVKAVIHTVLNEELSDKQYSAEETTAWCKLISEKIKERLKELELDRYKFIIQVVIGEQRGEGVKMGCRCFWDSDTDNYAQDIYMSDSLFCVAAAFGVFYY
ncbi:dynein light chain Tctex-type protein 2B-like [Lytechinus variegatus]|uniref:dynein light chain Tctex-type protein 2B-like n=1 Tax=Lytechinus variegatus TaxID=7654 RepID=UPI001BB1F32E|nr:dynein light chain Tctex-type protein 2B-like [Lytechinus variegatus]XP_041482861.1 dynein light chain Tctex-type protein 2B-like [Lytechinus variegatus]